MTKIKEYCQLVPYMINNQMEIRRVRIEVNLWVFLVQTKELFHF